MTSGVRPTPSTTSPTSTDAEKGTPRPGVASATPPPLSTPAPVRASKIQVAPKVIGPPLTAYQLQADELIPVGGSEIRACAGDWVILRNEHPIDVMTRARFQAQYIEIQPTGLTLAADDQTALEKALGFGSTESSATLRTRVERLANLSIGDIPVQFTVQQWEELHRRAQKRSIPVRLYLEQVVQRWMQDFWTTA